MNRRADSPVSTDKSLLRPDIIQEQASTGRSIGGNSPANHKVHEYGRILICSHVYDFFCRAWLICQTCCGFAFSQRSGSNSFNASGVGFSATISAAQLQAIVPAPSKSAANVPAAPTASPARPHP